MDWYLGGVNLSAAGRFTQSCTPWNRPPDIDQGLRRGLNVQDARSGGHPLRGAVVDHAATAMAVLVLKRPVDHVGDGLEAPVWMPVGAFGLQRRVVDLTHLVHVHERVQIR